MGIYKIAVVKGGDLIEIDTDKISAENYEKIVLMGLKHFTNAKMTKVTKASQPDDEARRAEAMAIAAENVETMYSGNLRVVGMKVAKAKGPGKGKVQTLARQKAKVLVKEEAKRLGLKVSHIEAKEITRLANMYLDHPVKGPMLIAQAEAELAAIEQETNSGSLADIGIVIAVSDRKVKQATEKTARNKAEGLSKTQASIPEAHVIAATRQGPQPNIRR